MAQPTRLWIYLLAQDTGEIKVGISGDLTLRMKAYRTNNPRTLKFILMQYCPAYKAERIEKIFKDNNEEFRVENRKEWFRLAERQAIDSVLRAMRHLQQPWYNLNGQDERITMGYVILLSNNLSEAVLEFGEGRGLMEEFKDDYEDDDWYVHFRGTNIHSKETLTFKSRDELFDYFEPILFAHQLSLPGDVPMDGRWFGTTK